jgi:hypothetical protein
MTQPIHDGTGFMVGAQAFLDLGQKLDKIHGKLDIRPIYKPVGNSGVINGPSSTLIEIPITPGRGRIWNVLSVGVYGPDAHTNVGSNVTAPAVPASGVPVFNNNNQAVIVTVTGGTVTAIAVNGVTTGATTGPITVPAFGWITLTYSVAPTWAWAGTTGSAVADIYAGTAADPSSPTLDNVIASAMPIPSTLSFSKQVHWCSTGERLLAIISNAGFGAQNLSFIARVAEYPVQAVEAMTIR